MTRPSIPRAAVAEAERLARAGHRVTLRRGDVEMIVEPPGTVPPSAAKAEGGNTCDEAFGVQR